MECVRNAFTSHFVLPETSLKPGECIVGDKLPYRVGEMLLLSAGTDVIDMNPFRPGARYTGPDPVRVVGSMAGDELRLNAKSLAQCGLDIDGDSVFTMPEDEFYAEIDMAGKAIQDP